MKYYLIRASYTEYVTPAGEEITVVPYYNYIGSHLILNSCTAISTYTGSTTRQITAVYGGGRQYYVGWSRYEDVWTSNYRSTYVPFTMVASERNLPENLFAEVPSSTIKGKYRFRDTYREISMSNIGFNINFIISNRDRSVVKRGTAICSTPYTDSYYVNSGVDSYQNPITFRTNISTYRIGFLDNEVYGATSFSQMNNYYYQIGNNGTVGDYYEIDFGDLDQPIPKIFKDWIEENLDPVYPYDYTVKSANGDVLAEINEAPAIKKVTLSTVGNTVYMSLLGTNDVTYTTQWTHEVPEGKAFTGLSYSPSDLIPAIPTGGQTTVNWNNSTTLYEIYGNYKPPTNPFAINRFNNTAESNRVDKTAYLSGQGYIFGILRDSCSLVSPTILIESFEIPSFNYCYIPIFGRYYYVTGVEIVRNGLFEISLSVDVLMTYKDALLDCVGFIDRNEEETDNNIIDKYRVIEQGVDVEEINVNNDIICQTPQGEGRQPFSFTVCGFDLDDTPRE